MARCIGSSDSMKKYIELEEVETRRLLLRMLDEPEGLIQHIRTSAEFYIYLDKVFLKHIPELQEQ
jgi:hypothetical protein